MLHPTPGLRPSAGELDVMNNEHKKLNVATAWFEENRDSGIMICGINWGGDPSEAPTSHDPSFFSDSQVNNYPYRNRLTKWFEMWGHPLISVSGEEGKFERSISQTNWLLDQDVSMKGRNTFSECKDKDNYSNFLDHVRIMNPRVILLCGIVLNDVLRSLAREGKIDSEFGLQISCSSYKKDIYVGEKKLKRFRIEIDEYQKRKVLALPHPTGSKGLSDAYISSFKQEIGSILYNYRNEASFS